MFNFKESFTWCLLTILETLIIVYIIKYNEIELSEGIYFIIGIILSYINIIGIYYIQGVLENKHYYNFMERALEREIEYIKHDVNFTNNILASFKEMN